MLPEPEPVEEVVEVAPLPAQDAPVEEPLGEYTGWKERGDSRSFYRKSSGPEVLEELVRIAAEEGPMQLANACFKLVTRWGFSRVSPKAQDHLLELLHESDRRDLPRLRAGFLWPAHLEPESWRGYRVPPADTNLVRQIEDVPSEEVANAAEAVLLEMVALPREDLAKQAARKLGFARLTSKNQDPIEAGLDLLIAAGRCRVEGDQICAR